MKADHVWKKLALFTAGFFVLTALFFWIVREDWSRTAVTTEPVSRSAVLEELTEGREIRQSFPIASDEWTSVWLDCSLWNPSDQPVELRVALKETGRELAAMWVLPSEFQVDGLTEIRFPEAVTGLRGQVAELTLRAAGGLSFWTGTSVNTWRFSAQVEKLGELTLDGNPQPGSLVMRQSGSNRLNGTRWIWPVAAVIWIACMGIVLDTRRRKKNGQGGLVLRAMEIARRYSYLLKTLVVRDFRVKYKASVLGVLWSFLNPLLMTFVYYFVFNTLFHSDIENFTAYLMSGIIIFNYFSEATNLGLFAIVGNASLITKVYMPKFIYPLSKVLSSSINLAISLIPLMAIMLLSGVQLQKSILLLPLGLVFLLIFCTGMALLLSALMVFFRDTQFLWGVMLTVWNFLTPIFYPETIIPTAFRGLYHCNPLYQLIFFVRSITIGGVSPTPITYFYCILASVGTLLIGWTVFRKTQDRFVLYL
ncbi:MAG: ABC transporter permease [Clostridia bacterium]|nr:ABC transporter permease [Clostridia bacterium]